MARIENKYQKAVRKFREFVIGRMKSLGLSQSEVESRGASIYMIGCPIYDRAIINEYAEFDNLVNEEESRIGIDYISNPLEYIFGYDYIFDTMYHCNSMGQQKRTELLINDMLKAGII